MKFSTAAVLAATTSVVSARLSFTKVLNKLAHTEKEGESFDAQIVIGGLHKDASKSDLKVIKWGAIHAYNKVFAEAGFSIGSLTMQSTIPADTMNFVTPEALEGDDYWNNNGNCQFCPPDNDDARTSKSEILFAGLEWYHEGQKDILSTIDGAELHARFEDAFCANLRASGVSSLADAKDCSFSFMENPSSAVQTVSAVKSAYSAPAKGKTTQVAATMTGLLRDFTEADRKLIRKSVVEAHQEAFATTGFSLKDFKVIGDVDIPSLSAAKKVEGDDYWNNNGNCQFCPPDNDDMKLAGDDYWNNNGNCQFCPPDNDDAHLVDTVTLVTGFAITAGPKSAGKVQLQGDDYWNNNGNCQFCPPDNDDLTVTDAEKLEYLHAAFEKSFCTKLAASGSANFANVRDCGFRFVDTPAAHAKHAIVATN